MLSRNLAVPNLALTLCIRQAAGLTTPPATYQRVPTATGGGGVSSAGSTPRGAGQGALLYEGSPLHGRARSPRAPGLQTFGAKYMPFAAGALLPPPLHPLTRVARSVVSWSAAKQGYVHCDSRPTPPLFPAPYSSNRVCADGE